MCVGDIPTYDYYDIYIKIFTGGFGFLAISLIVFISLYEFPVPPETETTMETFNDKDSAELSQNVSSALSKFSTSLYQVGNLMIVGKNYF